jgi:hypothetical protein
MLMLATLAMPSHRLEAHGNAAHLLDVNAVTAEHLSSIGGEVAPTTAVAADGTTAYVGEASSLVVLDVRDPAHPTEQARLALPATPNDIKIVNGWAYVATQRGDLHIIDVRVPSAPALRSTYRATPQVGETTRNATGVHIANNLAFITYVVERAGSYGSEFQIVDVRNAATPAMRSSSVPGLNGARDVHVVNNLAYVTFASPDAGGLAIYDVSVSASPVLRSTFAMQAPEQVYVANNRAYVTVYAEGFEEPGLQVIDVSNPTQPTLLSHYVGDITSVQVVGTLAYLGGHSGLQIVDVSNPAAIAKRGMLRTSGEATGIAVVGERALVSAQGGLHVVDVAAPAQPKLRNSNITRRVLDVEVAGTTAYLYDVANGPALQLADLSDPAHPALRGRFAVSFVINDIEVMGTTAYLAAGNNGVQIVDASNPDSPTPLGSFDTPGYASAVQVRDGIAYVADGDHGLHIVDVRNPARPQILGMLDTTGISSDVEVSGTLAYLADVANADDPASTGGVRMVDIGNPAAPAVRGTYAPLEASRLHVANGHAYVAAGTDGLAILNVSDTSRPALRSAQREVEALDVAVAQQFAYVADGFNGVQIMDVSNTAQPVRRGTIDTPDYAQVVQTAQDLVLIADDNGGLQIWHVAANGSKYRLHLPVARR